MIYYMSGGSSSHISGMDALRMQKIYKGEKIMALKEKDKKKWEEALKKLELMEENDEVEDAVMGNSRSKMSWEQGDFIFTRERFIFSCRGILSTANFSIKYSDIRFISKCMTNGLICFLKNPEFPVLKQN